MFRFVEKSNCYTYQNDLLVMYYIMCLLEKYLIMLKVITTNVTNIKNIKLHSSVMVPYPIVAGYSGHKINFLSIYFSTKFG